MSKQQGLEEKDKITIGQIRKRQMQHLDRQISELAGIIKEGYFNIHKAEEYLKTSIAQTLTNLQNIDGFASTEVLFPQ